MFNLSVSFTLSLYISLLHCSSTSSLHLLFDLPRLSVTSFIPNTACLAICLLAFYIMSCVSLSAQHGATLSRRPVKSREQRRFSTAIALGIKSELIVPRTVHSTIGDRAFCVTAARAWNTLTPSVQSSDSLTVFRRRLKTELFSRSFPD